MGAEKQTAAVHPAPPAAQHRHTTPVETVSDTLVWAALKKCALKKKEHLGYKATENPYPSTSAPMELLTQFQINTENMTCRILESDITTVNAYCNAEVSTAWTAMVFDHV